MNNFARTALSSARRIGFAQMDMLPDPIHTCAGLVIYPDSVGIPIKSHIKIQAQNILSPAWFLKRSTCRFHGVPGKPRIRVHGGETHLCIRVSNRGLYRPPPERDHETIVLRLRNIYPVFFFDFIVQIRFADNCIDKEIQKTLSENR
jgi:hypothetical protein